MSLPSIAAIAPGTWWKREGPPTWSLLRGPGPTEEGCRVILHLLEGVLLPRAVETIGVTGRRSSALAVETVSLLAVKAAIPRKEQVDHLHLKSNLSLLSQKVFSLTWFTMRLVVAQLRELPEMTR